VTHDELRALALEAIQVYQNEPAASWDTQRAYLRATRPPAVLALLDDLARLRAAARAFCEERTEAALIALMSEVER